MRLKNFQRFLLVTTLLAASVLFVRLGLNWALEFMLVREFSTGTGCRVTIGSVSVQFFPLSATAKKIAIRHSEEKDGEGFFAERVSVASEFLPLFRKQIQLRELKIEGASATSRQENSGFLKTLEFVLPHDHEKEAKSFFDIHLDRLEVSSTRDGGLELSKAGKELSLRLNGLAFVLSKPNGSARAGVSFRATAESGGIATTKDMSSEFGRLFLAGDIGEGKVNFAEMKLNGREDEASMLEGRGVLNLRNEIESSFTVDGKMGERALRFLLPKNPVGVPSRVELHLTAAGAPKSPELSGRLSIVHGDSNFPFLSPACRPTNVQAKFDVNEKRIFLNEVRADQIFQNGEAEYTFDDERYRTRVAFDLSDREWISSCLKLDLPATGREVVSLEKITGVLEAEGSLKGEGIQSVLSLDVPGKLDSHIEVKSQLNGKLLKAEFHEWKRDEREEKARLSASVVFNADSKEINIDELRAQQFPLKIVSLVAAPFLSASSNSQVSKLITPQSLLDGKFRGRFNSESREFEAEGDLRLERVNVFGEEIAELRLPFRTVEDKVEIQLSPAKLRDGTIVAEVSVGKKSGALRGVLRVENAAPFGHSGSGDMHRNLGLNRVSLKAEAGGTVALPTLIFEGDIGGSSQSPIFKFSGKVTADGAETKVIDLQGSADYDLKLTGGFRPDSRLVVNGRLREIKLENFLQTLSSDLRGTATGQFHYEAPFGNPAAGRGAAELTRFLLGGGGFNVEQEAPIRLDVDSGSFRFTQVRLKALEKPFTVSGSVSVDKGWMVDIDGLWSLAALPNHPESIEQLAGTMHPRIQVRGTFREPQLSGSLTASDVVFVVPVGDDVLSVRKGSLSGKFDRTNFIIDKFEASIGAGQVSGSAVVRDVLKSDAREIELHASLRRLRVQPVENLRVAISGTLDFFKKGEEQSKLSGKIHLDRASYEETIDLRQIVSRLARAITGAAGRKRVAGAAPSRGTEDPTLDLVVLAENDLIVETNIVRAELEANFRVTGTASSPLVDGDMNVLEGDFGTEANEFQISTGRANFRSAKGSLDPDLYVVAETSVVSAGGQQQQVRMFLSGTITKPKVEFVSDGGLRQEEIIGLLGLRTNLQTVHLIEGEQENRSFVDLIDPTSGATLQDRLSGITGFSTVQVDTALSATTGEVVPRLVAERPLWEKLTLHAMAELSGQQLSILNLSYPLNLYLNLVAGFRSIPPTGSRVDGSGSIYSGIRHRSTFPGTSLLPKSLSRTDGAGINSADQNFGLPR